MFPLFGGVLEIQPHRARLRERWYPAAQPALHLSAPVPGTSREIQLYSMNTVLHERLRNTFALGEVDPRNWTAP